MTTRADFEQRFSQRPLQRLGEGYSDPTTDGMWYGWQACASRVPADPDALAALDWNRLMSGERRALDPEHQAIFDRLRVPADRRATDEQIFAVARNHGREHSAPFRVPGTMETEQVECLLLTPAEILAFAHAIEALAALPLTDINRREDGLNPNNQTGDVARCCARWPHYGPCFYGPGCTTWTRSQIADPAVPALAVQQEPVAWMFDYVDEEGAVDRDCLCKDPLDMEPDRYGPAINVRPLYAAVPPSIIPDAAAATPNDSTDSALDGGSR